MSRCQAIAAGCFVDPDFPAPTDSICEKATLARRTLGLRVLLAGLSRYSSAEDPLEINRSDGAFRGGRPDDLVSLRISALVLSRKAREWICSKSP
jgi:hypothetical protein